MNEVNKLQSALNAIHKKEELSSDKVELSKVDDIKSLFEKGANQLKDAKSQVSRLKKELSNGLIIVAQNVPAQAKNALKQAEDLGADNIVSELNSILNQAKRLENEFTPLYRAL